MIMVSLLQSMKHQRMDKPAGARTVQIVLYGNKGIDPDLEEWIGFLFRRGGRKNILLNSTRL